jgi:hypothetical protein
MNTLRQWRPGLEEVADRTEVAMRAISSGIKEERVPARVQLALHTP